MARGLAVAVVQKIDVTYEGNFGQYEDQASALHELSCGQPSRLGVYPYFPYAHFFAGMLPVGRYYLMLPWMAEVYVDDLVAQTGVDPALICVERQGQVWGYANGTYLAPLIERLETSFTKSGRNQACYLSPDLAAMCRDASGESGAGGAATPILKVFPSDER